MAGGNLVRNYLPTAVVILKAVENTVNFQERNQKRRTSMQFTKWHSIENSYRQKHIDFFLEEHPELESETYIILEKLHGSNFQWFFQPGEFVKAGSRNHYLDMLGSFQGASIACLVDDNATTIAHFQKWADADGCSIRLFGELIGRGIGKGVDYGDQKRVLYFGIMVNDKLLPFKDFQTHVATEETVPIVTTANGLQAALDFDTKFDSLVLGKSDNICEGVVIQPYNQVHYDCYGTSPFILKKKNDEFKEKEKAPKVHVVDSDVERLNAEFVLYITDSRLQSAFSKHGEIETPKQIGEYIRIVMADAQDDFIKDSGDDVAALDKARQKQVYNVGSKIANMLKGYL